MNPSLNEYNRPLVKKYEGKIVKFKNLPLGAKLSIVWYMALDGEAWKLPNVFNGSFSDSKIKKLIKKNMSYFDKEYGKIKFGIVAIPTNVLGEALVKASNLEEDRNEEDRYKSIDDFLDKYPGELPNHKDHSWPPILSEYNSELLFEDGWHRFCSYLKNGVKKIKCVYFID